MVKPNSVGNTGAASENGKSWEALSSLKLKSAQGEALDNKKNLLLSKWEAWKAKKAENRALKHYDQKFDKLHKNDVAYVEASEYEKAANKAANTANYARVEADKTFAANKDQYDKAKSDLNRGEYIKDQSKRVAELLAAGGSVLRNGIKSFLKTKGDGAEKVNSQNAKARFAEIFGSMKEAKAAYKAKADSLKEARSQYLDSRREADRLKKEERAALADFEDSQRELRKIREDYLRIDDKCKSAESKYNNAKEKSIEADGLVNNARNIIKLHLELGKGDINTIKADLEQKLEVSRTIANVFRSVAGIKDGDPIPEDKKDKYDKLVALAGGSDEKALKKQLEVVYQYERAKQKQVESLRKSVTVNIGLREYTFEVLSKGIAIPPVEKEEK